jgi:hypothetical protein
MNIATETGFSPPALKKTNIPAGFQAFLRSLSDQPLAHVGGAVAIYSFLALRFIRTFGIIDPDVWWHLATGKWILQHHAVPTTDPFSSYGLNKPWVAYSWLFEIAIQLMYRSFGYVGIVLYEVLVRVALSVALFHLVRSLLQNFWRAVALTGFSLYAMSSLIGPRPGMLTLLFSIVELDMLLSSRRTGCTKTLWLVPPMFVIWVNWHIQFVYGLLILGVFVFEAALASIPRSKIPSVSRLPIKEGFIALLASFLATLATPYGPKEYSTVFQFLHQTKLYNLITELKAMSFRAPQDFVALFLVLGAAMAIGWRRELASLWTILLSFAAIVAFRSAREIWFLSIISACAIAADWGSPLTQYRRPPMLRDRLLIGISVLAVLTVGYRHYDVSNSWLEIQIAGSFPEAASQYIEKHHLQGPLFNHYNDGGFLIWRLPSVLVSVDSRGNVHGDERLARLSSVWNGNPKWVSDPELSRANIVLARTEAPLSSLLRRDSRFRIVYEDVQAVVFQRKSD